MIAPPSQKAASPIDLMTVMSLAAVAAPSEYAMTSAQNTKDT
jgi:hypothetical protein